MFSFLHPIPAQQMSTRVWLCKFAFAFVWTVFYFSLASPSSAATSDTPQNIPPLRVVSTPNPNVFPLLLALARNPELPVKLVPVGTGDEVVNAFSTDQGDALLSMTYAAAQDVVTGKIPQLQLVDVYFWGEFWLVAPKSAKITQFSQLVNQGVLISGPTAGGKGGAPDLIFQAAAKRAGLTLDDFHLCYLPVMQAAPLLIKQQAMNSNPACNTGFSMAPMAISMVEPASTGLVMQSKMSFSGTVVKAINIQNLFTDYTAWPQSQLPHGGVSVVSNVLNDPSRTQEVKTVLAAYRAAADTIMAAKGHPWAMMRVARTISAGIKTYYAQYQIDLPAPVIAMSLRSDDLVFRTDLSMSVMQPDLSQFLTEVVGKPVPSSFFHPL
jgi:hypothetical protein